MLRRKSAIQYDNTLVFALFCVIFLSKRSLRETTIRTCSGRYCRILKKRFTRDQERERERNDNKSKSLKVYPPVMLLIRLYTYASLSRSSICVRVQYTYTRRTIPNDMSVSPTAMMMMMMMINDCSAKKFGSRVYIKYESRGR